MDKLKSFTTAATFIAVLGGSFGLLYDWLSTDFFGPGFTGSIWFNPVFVFSEWWIIFAGAYAYIATLKNKLEGGGKWPTQWWFIMLSPPLILFNLSLDSLILVVCSVTPFFLTFALYVFTNFSPPFNFSMTAILYCLSVVTYGLLMYSAFPAQRLSWWKTAIWPFQSVLEIHSTMLEKWQKDLHYHHYHSYLTYFENEDEPTFAFLDEEL